MNRHNEITNREFTRQADRFAASGAVTDESLAARMVAAAGPYGTGDVLDVACGPGIVTAAIATQARCAVGLDLTEKMLSLAEERCSGLPNVSFCQGDAADLPFEDGAFDCVVTRLSIHHFTDPARVLAETRRVLKDRSLLVVADVVSSQDPARAELHNALEVLRDPSHVRMLPAPELADLVTAAGFHISKQNSWDQPRSFDHWARIVDDPARTAPLRVVMTALADAGQTAGIDLRRRGDDLEFTHRWLLIAAEKAA